MEEPNPQPGRCLRKVGESRAADRVEHHAGGALAGGDPQDLFHQILLVGDDYMSSAWLQQGSPFDFPSVRAKEPPGLGRIWMADSPTLLDAGGSFGLDLLRVLRVGESRARG